MDQHARPMALPDLTWSTDGGDIDDKGGFKAGEDEGEYHVEATAGGMRGQATVTITQKETPPPPPPPKPEPKTMRWTGAVPPQKWMNFYTKVLAKFATGSSLDRRRPGHRKDPAPLEAVGPARASASAPCRAIDPLR
jgi:hypothetical protein